PTEASAVGAFGALIAAAIHRRLNWHTMWDILKESIRITTMIMWICVGGLWLAAVYQAIGATHFVTGIIEGLPVGPWGIIILMQVTFFILGMLMDPLGIIFIAMPIYVPIILELGFNPVWFGVLFIVNMEMAYLTPPFGVNLFYMRAIVPKEEVSMLGIYSAALPFIFIQLIGLILVMIFPQIILWLPSMMM
ncbi:MAG: TRAP transporter large permease subunit, partial [Dehalococcoidia bacterium]|nr:TRAP transporter large permease subunit [Dehalococcoidia bacterium]